MKIRFPEVWESLICIMVIIMVFGLVSKNSCLLVHSEKTGDAEPKESEGLLQMKPYELQVSEWPVSC